MYIIKYSDQLIHYGVRGMKWGVRKDRSSTRAQKKAAKIEQKRQKAMSVTSSAKYTYKQRKHLSDQELRTRINRLQMEKQLKDLSKGRAPEVLTNGYNAASSAIGRYGARVVVGATLGPEAAAFVGGPSPKDRK